MDNRTVTRQLAVVFALMIGVGMIGGLLAFGIWSLADTPVDQISGDGEVALKDRMILRLGIFANHLMMFLVPAIIVGLMYHRDSLYRFFQIDRFPQFKDIFWWGVVLMVSYPIVAWLTIINESLNLPEFLVSSQDDSFQLLGAVLKMENVGELIMNLVVVALGAAVGEELLFRGVIQTKLLKVIRNPHLAIFIASLLFGSIHMQFGRLLPLTFLGLILGYSFYYSKNLFVPVILHLLNNAVQVVALYFSDDFDVSDIESVPEIPFWAVAGSLILAAGIVYHIVQDRQEDHDELRP